MIGPNERALLALLDLGDQPFSAVSDGWLTAQTGLLTAEFELKSAAIGLKGQLSPRLRATAIGNFHAMKRHLAAHRKALGWGVKALNAADTALSTAQNVARTMLDPLTPPDYANVPANRHRQVETAYRQGQLQREQRAAAALAEFDAAMRTAAQTLGPILASPSGRPAPGRPRFDVPVGAPGGLPTGQPTSYPTDYPTDYPTGQPNPPADPDRPGLPDRFPVAYTQVGPGHPNSHWPNQPSSGDPTDPNTWSDAEDLGADTWDSHYDWSEQPDSITPAGDPTNPHQTNPHQTYPSPINSDPINADPAYPDPTYPDPTYPDPTNPHPITPHPGPPPDPNLTGPNLHGPNLNGPAIPVPHSPDPGLLTSPEPSTLPGPSKATIPIAALGVAGLGVLGVKALEASTAGSQGSLGAGNAAGGRGFMPPMAGMGGAAAEGGRQRREATSHLADPEEWLTGRR